MHTVSWSLPMVSPLAVSPPSGTACHLLVYLCLPTAKSLSFGLRVKLLIFPLSIQSGLRPQELIPRGLAGTSHMRPTARALQLHFWETVHQRGHTGHVCQWTLASWWPACGAWLKHLLECTRAGPNCIRLPGTLFHMLLPGSSSHICETVGAAGWREHHGPCRSTCGIQESSGTVGF